jgi:hypothetical protein
MVSSASHLRAASVLRASREAWVTTAVSNSAAPSPEAALAVGLFLGGQDAGAIV